MEWERQRAYDRQAGIEAGLAEGLVEGRLEGAHLKAIESAENLIKMNILTPKQISEATGLSLEEVEKLAKKVNVTA
ncbi:MAG: hypothetical protein J6J11_03980 [Treponema sp.]|nr:hypothetical protein [Treponema sp.]